MKQKMKEIAINTGIGFGVLITLIGILAIVKLNYEFPGFDFIRSILSYGIFGLASHSIGKFLKTKFQ